MRDNGHDLKLPRSMVDALRKVSRLRDEYTPEQIAEITGIPLGTVNKCLNLSVRHLEETVFKNDGNPVTLGEQIASEGIEDAVLDSIALQEIMERLTPRERSMLELRLQGDKSQTQIADSLGMSQAQVSRELMKIGLKIKGEWKPRKKEVKKVVQPQKEDAQKCICVIADWIKAHPGENVVVTEILKEAGLYNPARVTSFTYYKQKAYELICKTQGDGGEETALPQLPALPTICHSVTREMTGTELTRFLEGLALAVAGSPAEKYAVRLEAKEVIS